MKFKLGVVGEFLEGVCKNLKLDEPHVLETEYVPQNLYVDTLTPKMRMVLRHGPLEVNSL
jgi:hypothetical protein